MHNISSLEAPEKFFTKTCTKNLADLQLSCQICATIFTDPQGKNAHISVQILKERSTLEALVETAGTFYMLQACMQGNCL